MLLYCMLYMYIITILTIFISPVCLVFLFYWFTVLLSFCYSFLPSISHQCQILQMCYLKVAFQEAPIINQGLDVKRCSLCSLLWGDQL